MNDKSLYIPHKKFTQYFTDLFIRNNQEALHKAVHILALSTNIDTKLLNIDDIIDKAVYAAVTDMYSNNMMNKQDSIADLVRNHLFNIFQYQSKLYLPITENSTPTTH